MGLKALFWPLSNVEITCFSSKAETNEKLQLEIFMYVHNPLTTRTTLTAMQYNSTDCTMTEHRRPWKKLPRPVDDQ